MKHLSKIIALIAMALALSTGGAFAAGPLKAEAVGKFISAIPDVEVFSDNMKKEGKEKALEEAVKPTPGEKTFTPYSKGVVMLKSTYPDDYKKIGDIGSKHGFASAEEWAGTADDVMLAYMAMKIEQQNPDAMKQMEQITPEQKAQMPPEALEQMERTLHMMKIVSAAPAADREAVKPHMAEIDAWLQRSADKEKADAAKNVAPAAGETRKEPAKKAE